MSFSEFSDYSISKLFGQLDYFSFIVWNVNFKILKHFYFRVLHFYMKKEHFNCSVKNHHTAIQRNLKKFCSIEWKLLIFLKNIIDINSVINFCFDLLY